MVNMAHFQNPKLKTETECSAHSRQDARKGISPGENGSLTQINPPDLIRAPSQTAHFFVAAHELSPSGQNWTAWVG